MAGFRRLTLKTIHGVVDNPRSLLGMLCGTFFVVVGIVRAELVGIGIGLAVIGLFLGINLAMALIDDAQSPPTQGPDS